MVLPAWLTFEAIKDIQLNYLSLKPVAFGFPPVAAPYDFNEATCFGLQFIATSVPGVVFTLEDEKVKVGQNSVFHNEGANDWDISIPAIPATVTVAAGAAVLLVKVSDDPSPAYTHYDLPNATVLS